MWGSGLGTVIMDKLDKHLPAMPTWRDMYDSHEDDAEREAVGTIDDEEDLKFWLSRGYHLTNFDEKGCMLFCPPPRNGLYKFVSKRLADAHSARLDLYRKAMKKAWADQLFKE
jgi:hypothetical protein